MNDGPSAGVDVLLSDSFHIAVQFEFDESRRQNVQRGRCSVLDHNDRIQVFGDYFAEPRKVLNDGACVIRGVRYGVRSVSSICFFLAEKQNAGCSSSPRVDAVSILLTNIAINNITDPPSPIHHRPHLPCCYGQSLDKHSSLLSQISKHQKVIGKI